MVIFESKFYLYSFLRVSLALLCLASITKEAHSSILRFGLNLIRTNPTSLRRISSLFLKYTTLELSPRVTSQIIERDPKKTPTTLVLYNKDYTLVPQKHSLENHLALYQSNPTESRPVKILNEFQSLLLSDMKKKEIQIEINGNPLDQSQFKINTEWTENRYWELSYDIEPLKTKEGAFLITVKIQKSNLFPYPSGYLFLKDKETNLTEGIFLTGPDNNEIKFEISPVSLIDQSFKLWEENQNSFPQGIFNSIGHSDLFVILFDSDGTYPQYKIVKLDLEQFPGCSEIISTIHQIQPPHLEEAYNLAIKYYSDMTTEGLSITPIHSLNSRFYEIWKQDLNICRRWNKLITVATLISQHVYRQHLGAANNLKDVCLDYWNKIRG